MADNRPVRLQMRRVKGFDLQAHSLATNGLPARKVDRSTPFGNFSMTVKECKEYKKRPHSPWAQYRFDQGLSPPRVSPAKMAVNAFASDLDELFHMPVAYGSKRKMFDYTGYMEALRGKNLACWCALCPAHAATGLPAHVTCEACAPCHAMVLLKLANPVVCEATP